MIQTKSKPAIDKKLEPVFSCDYCGRSFTKKPNKYRHQKYRCQSNPDLKIKTPKKEGSTNQNDADLLSIIQKQSAQIEQLSKKMDQTADEYSSKPITIEHQQITTNNNTTTNNYVTVYITEKVDFIKILTEKLGSRQKAIVYLKEKIAKKVDGDVDIFCDIYLSGPKETWSVNCADKKNYVFQLLDANNNVINDPGGLELYKNFKRNFTEALLYLTTQELKQVIDFKVGTDEFADRLDYLMDDFDLGLIQNKLFSLCGCNPDPFIKKVAKRIDILEKTFSLSFQQHNLTNILSQHNILNTILN